MSLKVQFKITKFTAMEDLNFKNIFNPKVVIFRDKSGICEILEDILFLDVDDFYEPFMEWINNYLDKNDNLTLVFKLFYFNTICSKRILDLILLLGDFIKKGKKIDINWYIYDNDEDIELEVLDFTLLTSVDIKLIHVNSE